jgi:hypothetical protein
MRILLTAAAIAALTTPALAHERRLAPRDDSNSYWLDYKDDISEAKRELANDLRGADDAGDRANAYEEYENEIADAKMDFDKEMRERGYRSGTVTVENDD